MAVDRLEVNNGRWKIQVNPWSYKPGRPIEGEPHAHVFRDDILALENLTDVYGLRVYMRGMGFDAETISSVTDYWRNAVASIHP